MATQPEESKLEIQGTRQFTAWLAEQKASLAFTTGPEEKRRRRHCPGNSPSTLG